MDILPYESWVVVKAKKNNQYTEQVFHNSVANMNDWTENDDTYVNFVIGPFTSIGLLSGINYTGNEINYIRNGTDQPLEARSQLPHGVDHGIWGSLSVNPLDRIESFEINQNGFSISNTDIIIIILLIMIIYCYKK